MRLSLSILGTEVLAVDWNSKPDDVQPGTGEATSYPVGFTAQHGDQRWQPGGEP